MAKGNSPLSDVLEDIAHGTSVGEALESRMKVDKEYRPLYSEISRLSATLGIARKACYEGNPGKVFEALALLEMQVPLALKMAEILTPEQITT